ncbi:hypothetical protein [Microbacterium sp. A93]|uniref:hypothetical protein n=1 Tax=Microbacterium sp. A93 TaxID=3450716 RepID=UPI003F4327AA
MEEFALLAVAGVLIIVTVSLFAPKLGVAAPILLVLVGIGCSLIPGAPQILLEPEWILMIALPPILYSAAVNVPRHPGASARWTGSRTAPTGGPSSCCWRTGSSC